MTEQPEMSEAELDALLIALAADKPEPSDGLLKRVVADAQKVDGIRRSKEAVRPVRKKPGFWQDLLSMIGGWSALAGLATATVTGIWIGVAPPQLLLDISYQVLPDTVGAAMDGLNPDFSNLLEEG